LQSEQVNFLMLSNLKPGWPQLGQWEKIFAGCDLDNFCMF